MTVLIFLGLYICLLWTDKHLGGNSETTTLNMKLAKDTRQAEIRKPT